MNSKKILVYFVSFLSLSIIFTAGYYFSYKKALDDFNRNAEERNNDFIMSLEDRGLLIVQESTQAPNLANQGNSDNSNQIEDYTGQSQNVDEGTAVDALDGNTILPTTKYVLQTYNIVTGDKEDEVLQVPSFLVGLNRDEVIEYLDNYMEDLPWNEFKSGLIAYELLLFSDKEIIIRKTYNPELIEFEYYIKSVDDNIVIFYSDQKTVYEYTNMSTRDFSDDEKVELEDGFFVKDLDELYAILENYTS